MYINSESAKKIISEQLDNLNIELINKLDSLFKLLDEDDWSFIIKKHALIESVINELIFLCINNEKLNSTLEKLSLNGNQLSKVKILDTYSLITPKEKQFLLNFSQIRNKVAHKFEYIDFSFESYFENLNIDDYNNWKKNIEIEYIEGELKTKVNNHFINKEYKIVFWIIISKFILKKLQEITKLKFTNELKQNSSNDMSGFIKLYLNEK